MVTQYKYRNKEKIYTNKSSKLLKFLYNTMVGRTILFWLVRPSFSDKCSNFLNSKYSRFLINHYVKKYKIKMSEYEDKNYLSFNDFFKRNIKKGSRIIGNDFISPCDSKLLVYNINDDSKFNIKDHEYSINDLVQKDIANDYKNGLCLIFRLEANNFHHYCFVDQGSKESDVFINGKLHTVQDVASKKHSIYKENSRVYTILHTLNYDDIIELEVGALMVGRITNDKNIINFSKGMEKGYFEFGGSTIVLLVKNNIIEVDKDILENSTNNIETIVKYGENIAKKSR